uniref:Uncharacterized protein n=1 Tax=Arundo donax TaxID=35708 RepID=A0A0A9C1P2_ARUDO
MIFTGSSRTPSSSTRACKVIL